MKVLLLGGPADGEERELPAGSGAPSHVVWWQPPPVAVVLDDTPRITSRQIPEPATYVPVTFGLPATRQKRRAFVYEPEKHLVDRLLNNYLRRQWIAADPA